MKNGKQKWNPFAAYMIMLAIFTGFVLADAFILQERYGEVQQGADMAEPSLQEEKGAAVMESTPDSYRDAGVSIQLTTHQAYESTIYVVDIRLQDMHRLQTGLAENTYGRNVAEKVSEMAREQQAILAINGDYYGARRAGYVIRNGVLYREQMQSRSQQDACIWPDGSMTLILEGEISAAELLEKGAVQVFSFGPGLIDQGRIIVSERDEVGRAMANNPRTCIAMIEPMHFLFVVADGRTRDSKGPSLYEMACFLQSLGARTAYNLDGGGSSTLVFQGEVRNFPTTNGRYQARRIVMWRRSVLKESVNLQRIII